MFLCGASLMPATLFAQAASDGRRDFDWEIGKWRTEVRVLLAPGRWAEFVGTSDVVPLWDGDANVVHLAVEGASGRIEGVSLRLYDSASGQWSLNYANRRTGKLSPPVYGGFRDGRGVFHGQDWIDGRAVLVRFIIYDVTPTSARFEQSISFDGGENWEPNWIATDRRLPAPER